MSLEKLSVILFSLLFSSSILAGHIGNRQVTQVRQWHSGWALIYVTPSIDNAASCATDLTKIVLDTTGDQDLRNRQISFLLTAMTTGLYVNPNCTNECVNIWSDVHVTKCSDMSIRK